VVGGEGQPHRPPFRLKVNGDASQGRWPVEDDEGVEGRGGQEEQPVMTVMTPRCQMCKQHGVVEVDERGWAMFQMGANVQDAFPDLDADQRELLLTGTHAHCWEQIFGSEDE